MTKAISAGAAKAGGIGIDGEHEEGGDQRKFAWKPTAWMAAGHADQLQRDIGHRREDAGHGHGDFERARIIAAMHDIGRRHIIIVLRDLPEQRHDREDERKHDDGVRQGEEAEGADRIDERRHRDDRIGGVKVAADEEPGDPGAELAPAKAPFVDMGEGFGPPPARRHEAHR